MTLRAEATQAYQATQADRIDAARTTLAGVLAPFDVTPLTVAHVEEGRGYQLVVFTDGDVHLGARQRGDDGWSVALVADREGWTELAQVSSLAHLGELLPIHDPPEDQAPAYPAWVQPSGSHDAYAAGDRVMRGGKVWESTVAGNVWEPGVSGWREVV